MNKEEKEWLDENAKRSGEGIESSSLFFTILTKGYKEEPLCALQLGIAILLDKPIAIVALDGVPVPRVLQKLAFAIEHCNTQDDFKDATARIMKKADELKL